MRRVPLPCGRNDTFEAVVSRLPAKLSLYLLAGCDKGCRIAGTTAFDCPFDMASRHFFGHVDNLFDAESVAVAEVVVGGFSAVFEIVESTDMSVGKVGDVNIVPHASAVGCGIIVAENADVISRAVCHLQNDGDKVGFGLVRLADFTALVCARRIEVAQSNVFESVRLVVILHKLLHHELGLTVHAGGMLRTFLGDKAVAAISVSRRRGREHEILDVFGNHSVQKRKRAGNVVVIILCRIDHTFSDKRVRRKVNDGIYAVFSERFAQKLDIKDVAFDKRHVRRHGFDMSRDKIVVNYDVHVSFFEFSHAMGADVACSARNQNHISLLARPRTSSHVGRAEFYSMKYYKLEPLVLQGKIVYNQIVGKTILHCDLNNFYASVEQKLHPEYDGMPLAVCGNPEARHGIVLAKNQLAKKAGVQTGETLWSARQKCPDIIFVPPHFDEYVKHSKQVFEIYTRFTDRVESFGIDECWLDVTGSEKLFGDGVTIANKLRELVKEKTGLTISVGVSFTKTLAKLGSDLKKPDATTVLDKEHYMDVIGDMSPSEMIMIGKQTSEKLTKLNVRTIRQLANADRDALRHIFGVVADNMINAAQGVETEEVKHYYDIRIPKSVSNGTTTPRDIKNLDEAKIVIYALADMVALRLRSYNLVANGIGLSIKNPALQWTSKQIPLSPASANSGAIAKSAISLIEKIHNFNDPLRAITVSAIRLENKDGVQISLFDEPNDKADKLEKTIDDIRAKYGYRSVQRGILLENDLTGNLHEDDDFRPFHQSKTT